MNTKHTPGPWKVEYEVHAQGPVHCLRRDDGVTIGKVSTWHYTRDNGEAIAEAKANARLIAAAPELLAFAQMIANGGINEAGEFTIESEARALIAKATGTNI